MPPNISNLLTPIVTLYKQERQQNTFHRKAICKILKKKANIRCMLAYRLENQSKKQKKIARKKGKRRLLPNWLVQFYS